MASNLGCSAKVFSRDVNEKQIPYHSIGKRKKFDPVEVRAHLKVCGQPLPKPAVIGRGRFAEALGL